MEATRRDEGLSPPATDLRARRRAALGLGLVVALYGNAWSIADSVTRLSLGGTVGGAILALGALWLALRSGRSGLIAIGVRRDGLMASLLVGLLLGLAMGLPGTVYLVRPELAPLEVRYEPLGASGFGAFLALVLLKLPFATALAEELAFRGVLQARLRDAFGARGAILIGSLIFTAWHLVVSFTTLQGTNLAGDPLLASSAYAVQNLAVLVAGLLWGWLREWSGNLAGCVLSHWLTDVLLVAGLYLA